MGRVTAHDLYSYFTIKCGFYYVIKTSLLPYSGIPANSIGNRHTKQENLAITSPKYCNQIVIIVSKITHLFSSHFYVKNDVFVPFLCKSCPFELFLCKFLLLIFGIKIYSKNNNFLVLETQQVRDFY